MYKAWGRLRKFSCSSQKFRTLWKRWFSFWNDLNQHFWILGDPYVFGVDPAWQAASNKIIFLNGYKMKISLIFGLLHMVFGVMLSAWNKVLKRKYAEIFLEFIPQLIFLVFIFCYLVFIIFFKWVAYSANVGLQGTEGNTHSEHCAPNLLITFINMMLFKGKYIRLIS